MHRSPDDYIVDFLELVNQDVPHVNHATPVYFGRLPFDAVGKPVGGFT